MHMNTNKMIGNMMINRERHMHIMGKEIHFDCLHILFSSACCISDSWRKFSDGSIAIDEMVLLFIIFHVDQLIF